VQLTCDSESRPGKMTGGYGMVYRLLACCKTDIEDVYGYIILQLG